MAREELLVRTFVELADSLVDDFDVVELLTRLADRCVELFDVAAAGLTLVAPDGDLRVMASSSEALRVLREEWANADRLTAIVCSVRNTYAVRRERSSVRRSHSTRPGVSQTASPMGRSSCRRRSQPDRA